MLASRAAAEGPLLLLVSSWRVCTAWPVCSCKPIVEKLNYLSKSTTSEEPWLPPESCREQLLESQMTGTAEVEERSYSRNLHRSRN